MKFRIIEDQSAGAVPQRFRKATPAPTMADISAALPDVAVNRAQREYNALPGWAKPLVAAQDMADVAVSGVTLGFSDNALALGDSLVGRGTYDDRLAFRKQQIKDARERAGLAGTAMEVLGTMVPAGALARSALSATRYVPATLQGGKGLAARTGAMALDGSTLGTLQALGNDQDLATGAAMGALGGGLGNLGGEAIGAGVNKLAGAFNKPVPTMSADELKAAGSKAFEEARNAGVIFKPEGIDRVRQASYADMAQKGYHPNLQPGAATAYGELDRLVQGGNVDLQGLQTLRELTSGGYIPGNAKNNEMIGSIIQRIDDFAANAGPADVLTGDSQAASAALKTGRDYWSRFRKTEKLDQLLNRAEMNAASSGTGGNIQNATKQQLKTILRDKKQMRGFTADEKDALRKAVMGTPGEKTLRALGGFDPTKGTLPAAFGTTVSFSNPLIGIPMMLGGAAARRGAEAVTSRNAEIVRRLIAAGGNRAAITPAPNVVQKLAEQYKPLLSRGLLAGALTAGRE